MFGAYRLPFGSVPIAFCCFILMTTQASGHGGDGGPPVAAPKILPKLGTPRAPKTVPALLSSDELQKIVNEKGPPPEDVLLANCMFQGIAPCRGIQIRLEDEHGKKILSANTGQSGLVGFEGLDPDEAYILKVENANFESEIEAVPGKMWGLKPSRRNL